MKKIGLLLALTLIASWGYGNERVVFDSGKNIAFHDNQIFLLKDNQWKPVVQINKNGELLVSKEGEKKHEIKPLMTRCNKIDVTWDYENGVITFSGVADNGENDREKTSRESDDRPDSGDRQERERDSDR